MIEKDNNDPNKENFPSYLMIGLDTSSESFGKGNPIKGLL